MKKWEKRLIFFVLGVSGFFLGNLPANAAPAESEVAMYQQPSGESFEAQLGGDEYLNYVLANETGDLIDLGEDDYWYYSLLDKSTGQTTPSDQKYMIDQKPENALTYKDIDTLEREEEPLMAQNRTISTSEWNQEQPLLVVLIEFEDISLKYSEEDWNKRVFSKTEKSLYTYYKEATNDAIQITPAEVSDGKMDGVIRVKLNQNHPNPGSMFDLVRPALKEALESIQGLIDISAYDTNRNGIIEQNELHIMGIFAGYEDSSGADSPKVWGHKGSYQGRPIGYPTVDGIKLNNYTLFGEVMLNKTTNAEYQSELGLVAHEFGHDLKLPDLYNSATTIIEQNGKFVEVSDGDGLGRYSLMSIGVWTYLPGENPGATPAHLDAYCKVALGSVTPQIITKAQTVDVKHISESGFNIFRVNTSNPQEYFLVENRQLMGTDEALKTVIYSSEHGNKPIVASGGISIYHVNERYTRNISAQQQLVTLKEADEGILGYSKLAQPRYYATNNFDGFYYKGTGGHGKEQQTILSQTTKPSTEISDGSYPEYSIVVNSEPSTIMSVTFKGQPVSVSDVVLEPKEATIAVGDTQQLKATVLPEEADNKNVTWTSSNVAVVEVSDGGLVTAKAEGTAVITVITEDGSKAASATITVKKTVISVTGVTVAPTTLELTEEKTAQLTVEVSPSNAADKAVSWSSSNSNIATVSVTGLVTAKTPGTATISVTTADGNKKADCLVTVSSNEEELKLEISHSAFYLPVDQTKELSVKVTPENAENKTIKWQSSDTSIAEVSQAGLVSAKTAGTATITATAEAGGKSVEAVVTVLKTSVDLSRYYTENPLKVELLVNDNQFSSTEFTSAYRGTLLTKGTIVGVEEIEYSSGGYPRLKLKDGNYLTSRKDLVKKVEEVPVELEMSHTAFYLPVDQTKKLSVKVTPENAENKTIKWQSSDPSIAEVNQAGLVSAKTAGTATITATAEAGGQSVEAVVKVLKTSVDLSRYYTENPLKVELLVNDNQFSSTEFTSAYRGELLTKGTIVEVEEIEYSSGGYPRLKLKDGNYLTSRKDLVKKVEEVSVELEISHTAFYLPVDQTKELSVKVTPEDVVNKKLHWSSSDPSIAEVNQAGIVTAKQAGTATITATAEAGGKSVESVVTVLKTSVDLSRYYTENPIKVKLLSGNSTYSDTNFVTEYRGEYLTKGIIVEVDEIEYSAGGFPRLKLKDGNYLTSRKIYVEKVE